MKSSVLEIIVASPLRTKNFYHRGNFNEMMYIFLIFYAAYVYFLYNKQKLTILDAYMERKK
jgi:hypothetical protein